MSFISLVKIPQVEVILTQSMSSVSAYWVTMVMVTPVSLFKNLYPSLVGYVSTTRLDNVPVIEFVDLKSLVSVSDIIGEFEDTCPTQPKKIKIGIIENRIRFLYCLKLLNLLIDIFSHFLGKSQIAANINNEPINHDQDHAAKIHIIQII